MIKNVNQWEEFEKNLLKGIKPDYQNNLNIYTQLYEEAVLLKVFPLKDPLFGMDAKIRMAKILKKIK